MKKYVLSIVMFSMLFFTWSCISLPTKSSSEGRYHEDLSAYRVDYAEELTEEPVSNQSQTKTASIDTVAINRVLKETEISGQLNTMIDTLQVRGSKKKQYEGFTIKVYAGQSRDEANSAKNKVYRTLQGSLPTLKYQAPMYTIVVGEYPSRMAAHHDLQTLLPAFNTAIIVPTQFSIKKD